MTFQEGMLKINFTDAMNAFKFDEGNRMLPAFHRTFPNIQVTRVTGSSP